MGISKCAHPEPSQCKMSLPPTAQTSSESTADTACSVVVTGTETTLHPSPSQCIAPFSPTAHTSSAVIASTPYNVPPSGLRTGLQANPQTGVGSGVRVEVGVKLVGIVPVTVPDGMLVAVGGWFVGVGLKVAATVGVRHGW